jgi:hypothetical protein
MLTVDSLRARAARLQQLNLGLAAEVARWNGAESPLLDAERIAYLKEIQGGVAGFDADREEPGGMNRGGRLGVDRR